MKYLQIQQHLDLIVSFLNKHWDFVNCHMVNYFIENHWNHFVPDEIKNYVLDNDIKKIIEETFWNQNNTFPNPIHTYINYCKEFWIENLNIAINVEEYYNIMKLSPSVDILSIKGFMGEKKLHEVEMASNFIANIVTLFGENAYVVDAGDGKGYLSSRLALQYHLKVLGIDANEINSDGAIERNRKLQRIWKGLVGKETLIKSEHIPLVQNKIQNQNSSIDIQWNNKLQDYKVITKFISPNLDFLSLIKNEFNLENMENINVCLTGLHTCGNLSPTCLKLFKEQNCIKILCNIGCCYHLVNEEFCDDSFVNKNIVSKNSDHGFPMSSYLREQRVKLGRNARMLASQSIHRTVSNKELPDKSLFYRSLLEAIIEAETPHLKNSVHVGKVKKYSNFQEYFQKCNEKLNLNLSHLSKEYLSSVESKYSNKENELNLFYLLRMCMAPVIESLILLDRLLYLYEGNFDKTYLINLFDPIISPRCKAIVCVKE